MDTHALAVERLSSSHDERHLSSAPPRAPFHFATFELAVGVHGVGQGEPLDVDVDLTPFCERDHLGELNDAAPRVQIAAHRPEVSSR